MGLKVMMGRTLYKAGQQDMAIQLYTEVIGPEMSHEAALLEYGLALLDRDMPEDAIKILLHQIVKKSEDKAHRTLDVRC